VSANLVELSARMMDNGGAVASKVRELRPDGYPRRRRLVILVHGYSTSAPFARNSNQTFVSNIYDLAQPGAADAFEFAGFYWPGDLAGPDIVSAAAYPLQMVAMSHSAQRLADYLEDRVRVYGGPLEVSFIGHSLGCRLILELLKMMRPRVTPAMLTVPNICLMAAAVVVANMWRTQALRVASEWAPRRMVLYSQADRVLANGFPIGETLAGNGFMPEAVGRFGQPSSAFTEGCDMTMRRYDHDHYWPKATTANLVARFLGLTTTQQFETARTPSTVLATRVLPYASRGLPGRELVGRAGLV